MKNLFLILVLSLAIVGGADAQNDSLLRLWYTHPAGKWVEALPVGNGRLGAMVYGDPSRETIQLNESTVWCGQPNRNDNPDAGEALPDIRKLVFGGKFREAQDLVNKKVISRVSNGMPYQTAGDLHLVFPGHEHYSGYYRELDIHKAVATTRYVVDGVHFEGRVFASFPDQVIIARIAADKPGAVNFSATMHRPAPVHISTEGESELIMAGVTGDRDSVKGRVQFQVRVKILTNGGSVKTADTALVVAHADAATLYISIATSFRNYADISGDAGAAADRYLQGALERRYEQALLENIAAYQEYFDRVSVDLGVTDSVRNPTDVRIAEFAGGNDRSLQRCISSMEGTSSSRVPDRADSLQHCRACGTINCIRRGEASTR